MFDAQSLKWSQKVTKGGNKMARDIKVSFKLARDKKYLLQQYAESYGVTMSALCAFIVGQWLYNQEKVATSETARK